MFDNNFGKCGPIFKILYQVIRGKILYVQIIHKDIHLACNMLLHYLVKFENPIFMLNVTINTFN